MIVKNYPAYFWTLEKAMADFSKNHNIAIESVKWDYNLGYYQVWGGKK